MADNYFIFGRGIRDKNKSGGKPPEDKGAALKKVGNIDHKLSPPRIERRKGTPVHFLHSPYAILYIADSLVYRQSPLG